MTMLLLWFGVSVLGKGKRKKRNSLQDALWRSINGADFPAERVSGLIASGKGRFDFQKIGGKWHYAWIGKAGSSDKHSVPVPQRKYFPFDKK